MAWCNASDNFPFFRIDQAPRRELKVSDPAVKVQTLAELQLAPSSVLLVKFQTEAYNSMFYRFPLAFPFLSHLHQSGGWHDSYAMNQVIHWVHLYFPNFFSRPSRSPSQTPRLKTQPRSLLRPRQGLPARAQERLERRRFLNGSRWAKRSRAQKELTRVYLQV